ncbi:HAMP domain-containing protein [Thiohalocapsa marina]|uniref:Sensor protein n=1 Tax=Thiohalocapsa marina TaxID=424902 RepID=A0A5M8FQV3_9GAMM|nr:type IV pili methyl-accepting chemotaxis transducer N-terminal domain-containing protein [Thiohalocapsa marina]KAA6186306.1 HAMP domain-containing protein [Thiohalocapsa marina]
MIRLTASNPASPGPRSILVVVGLLMAAVVLLGITGMVTSVVIAQISGGMAAAVNQSGTLRMQSYRIGMALAGDEGPLLERQAAVDGLAKEFEARLFSARLIDALPAVASDSVRLAYERVRWRWEHEMRRALAVFLAAADTIEAAPGGGAYLRQVDDFVADIHGLVRVLEERAERRIQLLRWMQSIALVLVVVVVSVTLVVVRRRVAAPLGALLDSADRVRCGDFSVRTPVTGNDELGRLGAAMNLMTDGLSRIYSELEQRVAKKTLDLARTNQSLDLLYRTSRALESGPVSEPVLRGVLDDVCRELSLERLALCLRDGFALAGVDCIATGDSPRPQGGCAAREDCALCRGPLPAEPIAGRSAKSGARDRSCQDFAVRDQAQHFGLLRATPDSDKGLQPWQMPLLEAVAGHAARALSLQARMNEGRRLVLHEERSILARELHDSLAQSLSYLKIQAARLDVALQGATSNSSTGKAGAADAAPILAELRTGINSAYRQLRELLTTFRLKMDGQGLGSALIATVREFGQRGHLDIALHDRLPAGVLSANEEVHVLQIVREALSNVVRHARATQCRVELVLQRALQGEQAHADAVVTITDDGRGFHPQPPGQGHYGMTIMHERAASLDGSIRIDSQPGCGTELRLSFRPRLGPTPTPTPEQKQNEQQSP